MSNQTHRPAPNSRRAAVCLGVGLAGLLGLWVATAPGQDLRSQLDAKQAQLDDVRQQEGVLSSEIASYSADIDQLIGEIAVLRNREAIVQERLERVQARLEVEKRRLERLREQLADSLELLRERLVAIYKSDEPDALTVILNADGFNDMLDRYEYLSSIEEQDAAIVDRVHGLRDETHETVERVRAARDEVRARKAELARTRAQLEARQAELEAALDNKRAALAEVQSTEADLEGDVSALQAEIQAQIQAALEAAAAAAAAEAAEAAEEEAEEESAPAPAPAPAPEPAPAGPVPGESSSGLIWPVSGPVTSGFGWRWGRMHEGIDIAVPAGTPIQAAASGTVILAGYNGGYGNYTCIDHGSGLSTCYAHQSSFAVSSGESVSQGQVIGSVGCTGSCTGDHLHFEVRVNGAAVDPMGYL